MTTPTKLYGFRPSGLVDIITDTVLFMFGMYIGSYIYKK